MKWRILYTLQAQKDALKIKQSPYLAKVKKLLEILKTNPYSPPFEKLTGSLLGAYSRRINIEHRLVYQVLDSEHVVKILRMWTHYE